MRMYEWLQNVSLSALAIHHTYRYAQQEKGKSTDNTLLISKYFHLRMFLREFSHIQYLSVLFSVLCVHVNFQHVQHHLLRMKMNTSKPNQKIYIQFSINIKYNKCNKTTFLGKKKKKKSYPIRTELQFYDPRHGTKLYLFICYIYISQYYFEAHISQYCQDLQQYVCEENNVQGKGNFQPMQKNIFIFLGRNDRIL